MVDTIRTRPLALLRAFFVFSLLTLALLLSHATPVTAQGVTIGLYTDETGSECSFAGDATGPLTVYVVVRPDLNGVRGARFKAVLPSCFQATYLGEVVPGGLSSIGDSQTGISITSGLCEVQPVNVLQIQYMRTGGTTACCDFQLEADPLVGYVQGLDCAFTEIPLTSVVSHFNADETCTCDEVPPLPPYNPIPPDGSVDLSLTPTLQWSAVDYDGDLSEFDVYLSTDSLPTLRVAGLTTPAYQPAPLGLNTRYFWRVVARDAKSQETSGPVWSFVTTNPGGNPTPPDPPFNPSPPNFAMSQSLTTTLEWDAWDPNYNLAEYDVYFGTTIAPPLVATVILDKSYALPPLDPVTEYYWRIVARDSTDLEAPGSLWRFSTNHPPGAPAIVSPSNGEADVSLSPLLEWSGSDVDGDTLLYDVYVGYMTVPALLVSGLAQTQYQLSNLEPGAYQWRVVARDHPGSATSSPVWNFATVDGNHSPGVPTASSPSNAQNNVGVSTGLQWGCTDPDGDPLTFDIYLGPDPSPPLVKAGHTGYYYDPPGVLESATTYHWQIVAHDNQGGTRSGPVWSFATKPNSPPGSPALYSPADGVTGVSGGGSNLAWGGYDPDLQPLVYDVYLGTDPSPSLAKSNHPTWQYTTGPLEFTTQYYWKIVARDPYGLEATSVTRTFTTAGNAPPTLSSNVSPKDGALATPVTPVWWFAYDPDGRSLTADVYFGTSPTPSLVASGATAPYSPGLLQASTTYYWRVVVHDAELEVASPTHYFTTVPQGDVDQDSLITAADAECALQTYLSWEIGHATPCGGTEGLVRSDVNCDGVVTPADARCIHKSVIDASCDICTGATPAPPANRAAAPVVTSADAWIEWDSLIVQLAVSGVPSLKSFGFRMVTDDVVPLGRIVRAGPTIGFEVFKANYWTGYTNTRFAGYTLGEVDASSEVTFIEIRCYLPTRSFSWIKVLDFMDDLQGAPEVNIYGNEVPVAFSSFAARARDGGIDVTWELSSDETMDSYTLYRHSGATTLPIAIAQGAVTSTRGSYFDSTVEPGTTYQYELAVQTHSGGLFRSQMASATAASLKLMLYQNQPNPFNPQTTIRYDLPAASTHVRLLVLDVSGRLVRTLVDRNEAAGTHSAVWDGRDDRGTTVSSGVYFSVLDADGERRTRKLVMLK